METIKIDDRDVVIKKLPLRKYPQLIGIIKQIQNKSTAINTSSSNDEILESLPQLINDCYPEFVEILVVGLDVSKEQVEDWGLADLIEVATKFLEVNRFGFILDQLKKMKAQPKSPAQALEQPENGPKVG